MVNQTQRRRTSRLPVRSADPGGIMCFVCAAMMTEGRFMPGSLTAPEWLRFDPYASPAERDQTCRARDEDFEGHLRLHDGEQVAVSRWTCEQVRALADLPVGPPSTLRNLQNRCEAEFAVVRDPSLTTPEQVRDALRLHLLPQHDRLCLSNNYRAPLNLPAEFERTVERGLALPALRGAPPATYGLGVSSPVPQEGRRGVQGPAGLCSDCGEAFAPAGTVLRAADDEEAMWGYLRAEVEHWAEDHACETSWRWIGCERLHAACGVPLDMVLDGKGRGRGRHLRSHPCPYALLTGERLDGREDMRERRARLLLPHWTSGCAYLDHWVGRAGEVEWALNGDVGLRCGACGWAGAAHDHGTALLLAVGHAVQRHRVAAVTATVCRVCDVARFAVADDGETWEREMVCRCALDGTPGRQDLRTHQVLP